MDRLAGLEWWDANYTKDGPPQQIAGFLVSPVFFGIVSEPAEHSRTLVAPTSNPPNRSVTRSGCGSSAARAT